MSLANQSLGPPNKCRMFCFPQVRADLDGKTLSGLINSAGVAWPAPLLHQPISDFQQIVITNLVGTLMVSKVTSLKWAKLDNQLDFIRTKMIP